MQDYYNGCSWGKVQFTSANNVIVGPIDLPCSGIWMSRQVRRQREGQGQGQG